MDPHERRALVRRRTRLEVPPAVPELRLHLAADVTQTWEDLERELDEGCLPPPFWAFAWVGGQGLARYVLDEPHEVAGRRVLDLATGSGLCALAARIAGAAEVTATDVDPFAEAAVALNAEVNGLQVVFLCADLLDGPPPDVEVLLAGDVCYDRKMTDRVLPWLRAAAGAGVRVLLGDPGRQFFPHGTQRPADRAGAADPGGRADDLRPRGRAGEAGVRLRGRPLRNNAASRALALA